MITIFQIINEKLYHHSATIDAKELLEKLPAGKDADKDVTSNKNPNDYYGIV